MYSNFIGNNCWVQTNRKQVERKNRIPSLVSTSNHFSFGLIIEEGKFSKYYILFTEWIYELSEKCQDFSTYSRVPANLPSDHSETFVATEETSSWGNCDRLFTSIDQISVDFGTGFRVSTQT